MKHLLLCLFALLIADPSFAQTRPEPASRPGLQAQAGAASAAATASPAASEPQSAAGVASQPASEVQAEPGQAEPEPERSRSVAMRRLGDDLFVVGGSATIARPVTGDLIMAGGSFDIDDSVAGDVLALGGRLRIGAEVGQSVLAAAGQLTVNRRIGRNLRIVGAHVDIGPNGHVDGNFIGAGGRVILSGKVAGYLKLAAGSVLIDGIVDGDASITARDIELGPNARIGGALRYRSSEPLRRDPLAQVVGPVERQAAPPVAAPQAVAPAEPESPWRGLAARAGWALGLALIAGLLLAALPGTTAGISRALRERPGLSLVLGFAFVVCAPVAALILLITLIGLPLGLLAMVLYAALLPLGYITAAIALGDWALVRWQPQRADRRAARIAAVALVLLVLLLLGRVPGVGTALAVLVLLAGVGAMMLRAAALRRGAPAA